MFGTSRWRRARELGRTLVHTRTGRPVVAGLLAGLSTLAATAASAAGLYGQWRVSFDNHPGGPLPFTLDVRETKSGPQAFILNPPERLKVEQVSVTADAITLSRGIEATRAPEQIDERPREIADRFPRDPLSGARIESVAEHRLEVGQRHRPSVTVEPVKQRAQRACERETPAPGQHRHRPHRRLQRQPLQRVPARSQPVPHATPALPCKATRNSPEAMLPEKFISASTTAASSNTPRSTVEAASIATVPSRTSTVP